MFIMITFLWKFVSIFLRFCFSTTNILWEDIPLNYTYISNIYDTHLKKACSKATLWFREQELFVKIQDV